MVRIPSSLNSKVVQLNERGKIIGDIPPEAEVRIIKRCDGNRPSIEPLETREYRGSLFSHQELPLATFFDKDVLALQENGVKKNSR